MDWHVIDLTFADWIFCRVLLCGWYCRFLRPCAWIPSSWGRIMCRNWGAGRGVAIWWTSAWVCHLGVGITAPEIKLENPVSSTVGKRWKVEDIAPLLTRFSFKWTISSDHIKHIHILFLTPRVWWCYITMFGPINCLSTRAALVLCHIKWRQAARCHCLRALPVHSLMLSSLTVTIILWHRTIIP